MVVNVLAVEYQRENERLRTRVAELEAKLAAMKPQTITIGVLSVDLRSGDVSYEGGALGRLTPSETRMLGVIAAYNGQPAPYAEIGRRVWPDQAGHNLDRIIHVNLSRMRQKVDRYAEHIVTVRERGIAVRRS